MAKELLGKLCPDCNSSHLMAERWVEHADSIEFRITCSDLLCSYEPTQIMELKDYLLDGKISIERINMLFPKGDDDDAA